MHLFLSRKAQTLANQLSLSIDFLLNSIVYCIASQFAFLLKSLMNLVKWLRYVLMWPRILFAIHHRILLLLLLLLLLITWISNSSFSRRPDFITTAHQIHTGMPLNSKWLFYRSIAYASKYQRINCVDNAQKPIHPYYTQARENVQTSSLFFFF